jgi:hypothetical protein
LKNKSIKRPPKAAWQPLEHAEASGWYGSMDRCRFGIVIASHTCNGIEMTFIAPPENVLTVEAATSFHRIVELL